MHPGRPLARGRFADVLAWGDAAIVKLYRPDVSPASPEREAANARAARAAGVRTPAVLDLVEVEGRRGIVFERVDGPRMLDVLFAAPGAMTRLARDLADLQADVHRRPAAGLRSLRERLGVRLERAAGLADAERHAAREALDALRDARSLCHGDLHPGNVLVSGDELVIVDWSDATCGDPHADLARSSLVMRHAAFDRDGAPSVVPTLSQARESFHAAWLARHDERAPGVVARLDDWMLPVAAARLAEPIAAPERDTLRRLVSRLARKDPHDVPCRDGL